MSYDSYCNYLCVNSMLMLEEYLLFVHWLLSISSLFLVVCYHISLSSPFFCSSFLSIYHHLWLTTLIELLWDSCCLLFCSFLCLFCLMWFSIVCCLNFICGLSSLTCFFTFCSLYALSIIPPPSLFNYTAPI